MSWYTSQKTSNWDREHEDEEHRRRRVAIIRSSQGLTHVQIDEIFEKELNEKSVVPESEEILASARLEALNLKGSAIQEAKALEEKKAELEEKTKVLESYSKVAFSASLARKIAVLKQKIDEENETDIEIRVSIVKKNGKWLKPKFAVVDEGKVISNGIERRA